MSDSRSAPRAMPPREPAPPPPPVAKVDMYTQRFSAECMRAKTLLDRKGVTYSEYIIDSDDESREVMLQRSGGKSSVPQIFINGRGIGGIDQLEGLDAAGQLDVMLGEKPRNIVAEEAKTAREAKAAEASPPRLRLFSRFNRP